MNAIEVNQVSKRYGKVQALQDVSFSVRKGELFGVIGPDGAGKTSLYRILCSLLLPDEGSVRVEGYDVIQQMKEIRKRVGYMPGKFSLYQDLTVEENLHFFATLFGTTVEENYDAIKAIESQVEPFKDRKAGALSGGMKQKLALCCALVHKPSVLFLDEPTTYLDLSHSIEVLELVHGLSRDHNRTVVMVLHDLNLALRYSDNLVVMRDGALIASGAPSEVISAELLEKVFNLHAVVVEDPITGGPMIVPLRNADKAKAD